jgi:ribose-phosphate pyrophosphokinase
MNIVKYPDGSSYANFGGGRPPQEFCYKVNTYEDLWHLAQIIDVYQHIGERPKVRIPCLIDAQADRRFTPHQSSGLKLVCKFLRSMKADFEIIHPHNPEVVEALLPNCRIQSNYPFVDAVLNFLARPYRPNPLDRAEMRDMQAQNMVLMSADAGGYKSLMKIVGQLNWRGSVVSASKSREYVNNNTVLNQVISVQDFGGKDVMIIDDICVYGGTFKGLAQLLRQRNCGNLYLVVTHMTVQDLGSDPVTDYFDTVFTSNSKHDEYFYYNAETQVTSRIGEDKLKIMMLW